VLALKRGRPDLCLGPLYWIDEIGATFRTFARNTILQIKAI
jgi:hypothetical protein